MDLNFSEYISKYKAAPRRKFDNYYIFSTLYNNIDLQKTGLDNNL